ncbi:MAG: tRNA lysidine(34) synthetase TilS [Eubacterium sp.]|nr:tRNA lysidine(34) synthetase TilS [Eubacterium sp.]
MTEYQGNKKNLKWNDLIRQTADYILRNRLIAGGDSVCVGFSGGVDSTFLLRALFELGKKGILPRFTLSAVHVNHLLRGEESMQDQEFAQKVCRELKIECYLYSYPVQELAASDGLSLEEEGRKVRQEAFQDCLVRHGVNRVALAHHANDQAETLLFRMARGSSLTGMGGIRPESGCLIHPLLQLEKKQIEEAMRERGFEWRTDRTNASVDFTRNALRHDVVPYLEQHVNSAAVRHMAGLAEDMALADNFLKKTAGEKSGAYIRSDEKSGEIFLSANLQEEAEIIQRYLILQALSQAAGRRKDLGREEIFRIRDLMQGASGREADLPYGMKAVRIADGICIRQQYSFRGQSASACRKEPEQGCRTAETDRGEGADAGVNADTRIISPKSVFLTKEKLEKGPLEVFFQGEKYRFRLLPAHAIDLSAVPRKDFTKWLDYDKIGPKLCLRHRLPGDFLQVCGDGGRQKLKKLLIDRKVPKEERDRLAVLASGSSIYWAVGIRISESCRITEDTRRILCAERIIT